METKLKDSAFTPVVLYGIDKLDKPRPVLVDLKGQLLIAGQAPTLSTALQDESGGESGSGSGTQKIESIIYPRALRAGAAIYYGNEFVSNARNLMIFFDLIISAGATNVTPTLQCRNINSVGFVDLITFGAIPGVVGLYMIETPFNAYRYRLKIDFTGAGNWTIAAYAVEGF